MFTALFYILLGCLFTYLAVTSGDETLWGIRTILPALIATFDFGIGFRLLMVHFQVKKEQE